MSSRPNPLQLTAYIYGARLPDSKREWVANDLMGPMATPRHFLRSQVSFVPLYLVLYFAFPGPIWIRALMVLLAVLLAAIFAGAYMNQNRARRLQKHGLGSNSLTYRQQKEADRLKNEYEQIYLGRRAAAAAES
ncbi:hypothetical protein GOHSU_26_00120 [Gordonia hirsuta DSM 44140 = NBRC 16056]|uniref:DUF5313 domain-containing protein n=1 Tax=Gordonia hirsuta DSM 44140 = NBRC 16056 TaxID=1121927 RepID=L7L9N6_9ACTN|nr:DUF5313 family protein [Gordonia hirsuta]GAC57855.1 hypothetical protein GOHSU_26_00120 [Gordonia hirsuta DSM 44140 = NBRC 16056]